MHLKRSPSDRMWAMIVAKWWIGVLVVLDRGLWVVSKFLQFFLHPKILKPPVILRHTFNSSYLHDQKSLFR